MAGVTKADRAMYFSGESDLESACKTLPTVVTALLAEPLELDWPQPVGTDSKHTRIQQRTYGNTIDSNVSKIRAPAKQSRKFLA